MSKTKTDLPVLPDLPDLPPAPKNTDEPAKIETVTSKSGGESGEKPVKPVKLTTVADSVRKLGTRLLMDVDDFDEQSLKKEFPEPLGFPKTIRDSSGNEVDAEMAWAPYESIYTHPWVKDGIAIPVTPENCPDIPLALFNAEGIFRNGSDAMLITSKPLREKYERINREQGIEKQIASMGDDKEYEGEESKALGQKLGLSSGADPAEDSG